MWLSYPTINGVSSLLIGIFHYLCAYEILSYRWRSIGRPACRTPDQSYSQKRRQRLVCILRRRLYGACRGMPSHNTLQGDGFYGVLRGAAPSANNPRQHETGKEGDCRIPPRRTHSHRLPVVQSENSKIRVQYRNPGLLLHLSESMGMEGMARKVDKEIRQESFLHTAVRN